MRPPLEILDDLRDVLRGLNVLKAKRSKLIAELAADRTVTPEQVQGFLVLAKVPPNDVTALSADFDTLQVGAQQK